MQLRPAELSSMRAAVGRRMVASKQVAPHFYVGTTVEVDAALTHITDLSEASSQRASLTGFLVRATVVALERHPLLNSVWRDDELMRAEDVNVGLAIALEDGLVAPAIFHTDASNVSEATEAVDDLVSRARSGGLRSDEMTQATFTVSNLGMFGVNWVIPIVAPPQVGILGVGRTERVLRNVGEEFQPRSVMEVSLSADHRAVDGAEAALFLRELKDLIEHPEKLDA